MNFLIVGLGGFGGAIARYLVYLLEKMMKEHSFPFGTLVINVIGCVLAGMILALSEKSESIPREMILFGTMGFIGSFTTFSTFSVETFHLLKESHVNLALANIAGNIVFGILAVNLGRWIIVH